MRYLEIRRDLIFPFPSEMLYVSILHVMISQFCIEPSIIVQFKYRALAAVNPPARYVNS